MGRWILGLLAVVALAGLPAGCKKRSVAVAPTPIERPEVTRPAVPTTQELLHGPRSRVELADLPMSAEVPAGWKVVRPEGTSIAFLQGPLPSGDEAHIQLTRKPSIWGDQQSPMSMQEHVKLLEAGAKKEQAANPQTIKRVEVHPLGSALVFEKESVFQPPAGQILDTDGKPVVVPLQHRWTITVFVPQGKSFVAYELNFLNLSQAQYETDKDFLAGIVGSLKLDVVKPASQE